MSSERPSRAVPTRGSVDPGPSVIAFPATQNPSKRSPPRQLICVTRPPKWLVHRETHAFLLLPTRRLSSPGQLRTCVRPVPPPFPAVWRIQSQWAPSFPCEQGSLRTIQSVLPRGVRPSPSHSATRLRPSRASSQGVPGGCWLLRLRCPEGPRRGGGPLVDGSANFKALIRRGVRCTARSVSRLRVPDAPLGFRMVPPSSCAHQGESWVSAASTSKSDPRDRKSVV